MPPLVSVVVPNYNHARFIPQRLQSIAMQTFQDFEVIVLDDASTDESVDTIKAYSQSLPMHLVTNERNSGSPFIQWKRGATLARGEYLWIAESDDYADPRFLAAAVAKLEENPTVGLAYCQSMMVDEDGRELGTFLERYLAHTPGMDVERWRADYVANGRKECADYLLYANTIPNASAVVVRKDLFLRTGSVMPILRLTGDWLEWIRILLVSDIAFIAEPFNYFREHDNTVRRTIAWGTMFTEFTIIRSVLAEEFSRDSDVLLRVRKQVAKELASNCSSIEGSDDWAWFSRLVRPLWNISPRNLIVCLFWYIWYRVLHSGLLADLRRISRRFRTTRA